MENILIFFPTWKSYSVRENCIVNFYNKCFYFHKYIMPICIKLLRTWFQVLACVVFYCSCVNPVHTKQRSTTVLNLNHNSSPHKVPNSLCKGCVYKESHTLLISVLWIMTKGNIYWSMPHQTSMFPFHESVSNSYCISLYEYCLFYQCITSTKLSLLVVKCVYYTLFWYDVTLFTPANITQLTSNILSSSRISATSKHFFSYITLNISIKFICV
jgi:hypothetical protein